MLTITATSASTTLVASKRPPSPTSNTAAFIGAARKVASAASTAYSK